MIKACSEYFYSALYCLCTHEYLENLKRKILECGFGIDFVYFQLLPTLCVNIGAFSTGDNFLGLGTLSLYHLFIYSLYFQGLSLGFPAILLPQLSQVIFSSSMILAKIILSLFQEESSLFRNTSDTLDQRSQHAFNLREDHTFIIGRTNIASYILYALYKTEKACVFLAP